MNQRLFSLCTPCPEGFSFCGEFRSRDFRSAPFVLHAPSPEAAGEFLGSHRDRLAGVILVPGEHLSTGMMGALLSIITYSPALFPYLADFAGHQLKQLDQLVSREENTARLALEHERLSDDSRRAAEEFEQFRSSLLREIEERRAAERQLADSEEQLRQIISSTGEAIYGIDLDGNCTFANESCLSILGYQQIGDVLGRNMHDLIHFKYTDGRPMPAEECRVFKAFRDGVGIKCESEYFWRRDGTSFPVEYSSYPIRKDGAIVGGVVIWRDITERKQRQKEMALMSFAFDNVREAVYLIDEQARFMFVNAEACRALGYSREELLCRGVSDIDPDFPLAYWPDHWQHLKGNGSLTFEGRHRDRKGHIFPVEVNANFFKFDGKEYNLALARDITERKRVDQELRDSRSFLDSIVENIPNMVFVKDAAELRFVKFNRAGEALLGIPREELFGKNDYDFFPAREADFFTSKDRDVLAGAGTIDIPEETIQTATGQRLLHTKKIAVTDDNGIPRYLLGISEDITERKQAEEERRKLEQQLLHAQKLESLGVLAGGIAHDFNNILTAIIGNADLALMRLNPESPAVDNLRRIEQAASQAADLAKQMLAYSGKGRFVVESLDMNRLLEEMLHMLEVSISKKVLLRFNLTRPLPPVEADATQMRQIIMNLVINASEAIGDRSGVIALATGCMDCSADYLKDVWLAENLSDGLYVYLEISDNGCGMDNETQSRIFDPFFTTKFTGRGLGMAAVLGIVRGHRGAIKVHSEPDKGTTFKILLPASGKPVEIFDSTADIDQWQGSGTVLLVDDEETVRGVGRELLKELGFNVLTANDGRQALEVFATAPDISFVILDLTMPHMDGEQCFRELRRINPDVRVIISSGYNEQEVTERFLGKDLAGFIQKPYKLSQLRETIKNLAGRG